MLRFWLKGWIEEIYLVPKFHFHYTGFEFIQVPGQWTYALFALCGLSALSVAFGWKYRIAIVTFFLSFLYIELMDKTTYLNHYYLVSILSFMLIFLPAHANYSLDAKNNPKLQADKIPKWMVDSLKFMIAIVYVYAGLAKFNHDWMFEALPLAIWLPTKVSLPFLGQLMHESWMHYIFSWGGAFYDTFIVFFLLYRPTRIYAFMMVVIFHVLTALLFPIGLFPYLMIASSLLFFSTDRHEIWLNKLWDFLGQSSSVFARNQFFVPYSIYRFSGFILVAFLSFQLIFPFRHLLYTDNVYWTEQGYRFSWRVMLMEKTAYANFKVVSKKTGKRFYVQNQDFLTPLQEKQMSTQPDFILEYAKYLGAHFTGQGHEELEIYVESYASLNGRRNQKYISNEVNLLEVDYRELCQKHLTPLNAQ